MRAITGSGVSLLVGSRTAHGGCGESIVLMVLLLLHAHFFKVLMVLLFLHAHFLKQIKALLLDQ